MTHIEPVYIISEDLPIQRAEGGVVQHNVVNYTGREEGGCSSNSSRLIESGEEGRG